MTLEEQSSAPEHIAALEAQLNQVLEQWRLTQEQLAAAHKRIEELEQQRIPSPEDFSQQEHDSHSLLEAGSENAAIVRWLFDSNVIGVFVSDFAGTFLEANDAFLDLLGYTREELHAGMIQRDIITPPEFHYLSQMAIKALREEGSSHTYEKEYAHKSGKRIPVLVAVTRVEHTETCVGFVLEISERKELERRKDIFITTASHELRTPLTLIQGYIELLAQYDNLPPELSHSFLSNARCACDELVLLLANMMDASCIEVDRRNLHCSQLPLKEVCTSLVAHFEPWILLEQRQVVVDIADHLTVWADGMRCKQILRNLMANALRYSPSQTPIWITATLVQDGRMVCLSVRDHGQGIPPDQQRVIFDKFVRLDREMHSTVRGSGLGLYISRQLVEAMGGTITVTSSGIDGEGSCFSFLLPVCEEAETKPCSCRSNN